MDTTFSAELFEWRGPAPYVWLALPPEACAYVEDREASYGWGAVPVQAEIGGTVWETSLLPRAGGYVLPVKKLVQQREDLALGDVVTVGMSVVGRGGRRAETLG